MWLEERGGGKGWARIRGAKKVRSLEVIGVN